MDCQADKNGEFLQFLKFLSSVIWITGNPEITRSRIPRKKIMIKENCNSQLRDGVIVFRNVIPGNDQVPVLQAPPEEDIVWRKFVV